MNETAATTYLGLDLEKIRAAFPVLGREVNGFPLAYFDNAATTQKPQSVISALTTYYSSYNANIHRGVHTLADEATTAFERTRKALRQFINARETEEIIFTKGTTESINLVAATFGRTMLDQGDEIIITGMEHHANIVPWQMLAAEKGIVLKVIPVSDSGEISLDDYQKLLSAKTKLVAVSLASNTLGTINPINEIVRRAREMGAATLIDAAQGLPHLEIDVQAIQCDFLVGSAHKMYGPTGVGFLYGTRKMLEKMPPYQGGGEMIREVSFSGTTYNEIPFKFEAGTPNIADIIAWDEAINFVNNLGKKQIAEHEGALLNYATTGFKEIEGVKIIGEAKEKVSVLSFVIEGMHPFDVGMMLDATGIAVRTGHHCTMPLMERYQLEGTVRASFAVYNTFDEIDRLVKSVRKIAVRSNQ